MKKVFKKTVLLIFEAAGRLPLKVLYLLSDIIFFLVYHIVRYRRKLVKANLEKCFPEANESERHDIARRFYRNFADYVVETLKLIHITDDEARRIMAFEGLDVIDNHFDAGRNVVIYFSHCFNWEYGTTIALHMRHNDLDKVAYGEVYRPLNNKFFDKLMLRLRERFGTQCYPMASVMRKMVEYKREEKPFAIGFMSDQKAPLGDLSHVTTFLNRPSAFITGTETLARKLGCSAVYWDMHKEGRGRYKIVCRNITDNVADSAPGEVTEQYVHLLENTIKRNPSIWLWTHNRWKYPLTPAAL